MKVKTNGMAARSYAFSQNQFENIIFKDILVTNADIRWFTNEARERSESSGCCHTQ